MPRYAELIYNGFWFSPEREMLQALIDKSQEHVEGEVRLKLYKGNVIVTGRESAKSLYSTSLVTFEDDKGAYDQKDAEGFIRLNALRLRTLAARNAEELRAPMFSRMEIGRIAGIPIYLDMMFVLVLLVFTYPYFTSGNTQLMSAGFIIVVGLLLSILLHELGHAFAGRLFNARVSHIELTGIGGIAHFERSLPRSALARSVISLAGPAVNLGLWLGLGWLAGEAGAAGNPMVSLPLAVLASANFFLMVFNLLPAYPLDGGHTLDAWLGALLGPVWSVRIVAGLGLVVAAGVALFALPTRLLPADRRPVPGPGQLAGAAERRGLAEVTGEGAYRRALTPTRNAIGLSRPTACGAAVADGRLSPWRSVLPPPGGGAAHRHEFRTRRRRAIGRTA